MDVKTFKPGDRVELQTRGKSWVGSVLESYDSSIVLLKLDTGYNIGIRESEVLGAKLLEKVKKRVSVSVPSSPSKNLKKVAVIITGGTISSRLDPKSGGTIPTGKDEILQITPRLEEVCNVVSISNPFLKVSEDMSFLDWKKIAVEVEKFLVDEGVDGVIITHGTDTLSYTASALAFFLRNLNKPVALTYSQRSIDRGSTDAALNLVCAAKFAVSDIAEVAIVGHESDNDDFCLAMPATKTRKMHTSRRDAFQVINAKPIARISEDSFLFLDEFNARDNDRKVSLDAKYSDKVALIKILPSQDPAIIDWYVKQGYKGLILEATGLGHVPARQAKHNWLPSIKKAIQKKVVICAAPQTLYGRLNPNVYGPGRDLQKTGILFLDDMFSETAFVKLSWILGHTSWARSVDKIKEKMLENIAREFTDRLEA